MKSKKPSPSFDEVFGSLRALGYTDQGSVERKMFKRYQHRLFGVVATMGVGDALIFSLERPAPRIVHVIAGTDQWEPSQDQLIDFTELFSAVSADPVVVTRVGVDVQMVGSPEHFIHRIHADFTDGAAALRCAKEFDAVMARLGRFLKKPLKKERHNDRRPDSGSKAAS